MGRRDLPTANAANDAKITNNQTMHDARGMKSINSIFSERFL